MQSAQFSTSCKLTFVIHTFADVNNGGKKRHSAVESSLVIHVTLHLLYTHLLKSVAGRRDTALWHQGHLKDFNAAYLLGNLCDLLYFCFLQQLK